MTVEINSKPASATGPLGLKWLDFPKASTAASANWVTSWPEYMVDAFQRSVLFLDLLRQRGNEEIEITSRPMATVLRFDHEVLMSGRSLPRPINYALLRIVPPGVATDPRKRPVVVVDPRAGQGPGIGGFKAESEIGDALNAGHPVYFIGFGAMPAPGQQFLDVVEGQVKFFERVVELHPDAPRPFAIGNCQAGYQTLMVAMLRPDLFGPCLVAGSPMSYWQGVHGKNPMRYSGGLLGGSWLTAMTSDLGNGKFDGTGLILNFDVLNPANWLWGKQYEVYADIDTGAERFLKFEKWWGDFIELNGDELQYLVDNLFIGDKLTRNQLQSHDGTTFDVRNVTSPIIVFTSTEDNISPPPQTLGWILDLYRDVEDIRATGRTIVYSLEPQDRASRALRLLQGGCEGGRGVRAADGRHRLPVARPLRDGHFTAAGGHAPGRLRHRRLDRPLRGPLARRHPRARPQQPRGRSRLRRRGPAVGTEPLDLPYLHAALGARSCQPAIGGPDRSPEPAQAQLHDLRRSQPVDEGRATIGRRRGSGPQAGDGRQSVPRAADTDLGPDHCRPGRLSRGA